MMKDAKAQYSEEKKAYDSRNQAEDAVANAAEVVRPDLSALFASANLGFLPSLSLKRKLRNLVYLNRSLAEPHRVHLYLLPIPRWKAHPARIRRTRRAMWNTLKLQSRNRIVTRAMGKRLRQNPRADARDLFNPNSRNRNRFAKPSSTAVSVVSDDFFGPLVYYNSCIIFTLLIYFTREA